MSQPNRYLLAIESAIAGGSIALLQDGTVVAKKSGATAVSRAEDLLPNIDQLLQDSGVGKRDLNAVAVSLGPGSYTGLRIGIATVMGLCKGLGIDYIGVDLFNSIAEHFKDDEAQIALPMGKSDICFRNGADERKVVSLETLASEVSDDKIFAHSDLVEALQNADLAPVDIGRDLAVFIGFAARGLPASSELRPIYIQNPRFGQ